MDLNLLLTSHLSSVMRSCRHYPHYRPLKDEIPLPYDVRLRQGYNKDEYKEATPLHHVKLTSGELMTMSRFAFIVDAQDTSGTVENDVKFSLQLKPTALHIHDGTQISIWNQFKATEPTTTIHILRRPVKEAVPLILAAPLIEDSRNHLYADPAAPLDDSMRKTRSGDLCWR
ncbi:hypothetical protein AVEN_148798-1 [Araneus ventricosus]|uniref:Uncharacterized protein n=1 Tax=Araneus ventricosus TaxID=182803 RepID=A0A4Y2H8P3_ARAVE|nr:hypothetical protein AVEN_116913-1 [Araneus ventricosus]GBM60713.1 hypothetical protein AVEN_148798-1 [Araneus ventricosus]